MPLVLGSRRSALAQAQAQAVGQALQAQHPGLALTYWHTLALADKDLSQPLHQLSATLRGVATQEGGSVPAGVFVKELEEALLAKHFTVAVHSLKDVPTELHPAFAWHTLGPRAAVEDVWLHRQGIPFWEAPVGCTVGTSSLRRSAQLQRLRGNDLVLAPMRGNLQTRLAKLAAGEVDALVLAKAGLDRLGLSSHITSVFDPLTELMPAPAQGFLGVEWCQNDEATTALLTPWLHQPVHRQAHAMALAERTVLRVLEGGCQLPLGALAVPHGPNTEAFTLHAQWLSACGQPINEGQCLVPSWELAVPYATALANTLLG